MLCLSQTTGYAVYALTCLSTGQTLFIQQVAARTGIQKPYLAKIINQLTNKKLVQTKRGYRGGIGLARPASTITLLEIVEAIEDPHWLDHCFLGLQPCNSQHICPMHEVWAPMKDRLRSVLQQTTLAEIIATGNRNQGIRLQARCGFQVVVDPAEHLPKSARSPRKRSQNSTQPKKQPPTR